MANITDHDNYRELERLLQSPEGKAQRAQYPDSPLQTVVGISEAPKNDKNEEVEVPEGFLAARRTKYLDKTPESLRGSLKVARAIGPSAGVAGLGALAGGLPSGGIGALPGMLAALGAKGIYDTASGLVVNPLSRLFTGSDLMPSSNALSDKIMDKLGVPYPESRTEEVLTNISRAGVDAFGGGPALGKIIADAAPAQTVSRGVGTVMQEAPGMQVLGGMSGQAAVEKIDPEGRSPVLDTFASLAGGMAPFLARGTPNAFFGKRQITPAHEEAMRRAFDARRIEVSNSNIEMTPQKVNGFVRDAQSNSLLSAATRGVLQGRGFFEPMQNYLAVKNAEANILQNVLNPSEVVENINRAQAGNFEQEFPGYMPKSDAASNDAGVVAALSSSNSNPRVVNRSIANNGALSQASQDMASTGVRPEGAFNEAAAQRQSQFLDQPMRAAADAGTQVAEQQRLLQEIQNARALAEEELKNLQMRIANQGSALERGAASEATAAEYWKKYEALQGQMQASKIPSELNKPISTDPLVQGIQESKAMSATALERANPAILETEQQLARFGVEPTATGEAPAMGKTVIAAEPAAMGPVSAMTPERAAQIEAGIKAIPAPKGPVKYLEDLGGPVESIVRTPSGQMVKVRRKLVELEDVVRGGKSEAHPAEYQNRDRSTAASQNQVNEIVGRFNPPEITGSNPVATSGAPIVGPQGNVLEGGHARMSALERVLTEPGNSVQREAYLAELKKGGHDVTGFKNPVEVQERVTSMTPQEVQGFVQDLNRPSVSALSTSDMARGDAGALGKSLAKLDPTKPLDHPANAEFVRSMNSSQLGSTEYASYLKPDGTPNTALTKRYGDALSQAAYGGKSKAADALLRSLRDDSDTMVRTIASAMEDSAGGFAKLRSAIESGQIPPEYDLGSKVAEAASFVREARKQGTHPMEALKTNDMFGGLDAQTRSIVELFYNEGSNRQQGTKALGQTLNQMAAEALQQDTGLGLGGQRTPDQLIQRGKQSINSKAGSVEPVAESAMAKQTEGAPPAESATLDTEAVSVASAPPEQFTVQNATKLIESYRAKMKAAKQAGGVEWANAKENIQPVIDRLEAQLKTEAPTLQAGKEAYAAAAPDLIQGLSSKIRKAGMAGDPQNVAQSQTLDLWFDKKGASAVEAKRLAKIMGDTPDNVDAVRQYVMSRVASETGEAVTGAQIRSWKKTHDQILSQPEFASIGEELRKYANQLDSQSTAFNQAGKDIAAERMRLQELESSRGAAESNLTAQRGISEEAGSMRVAKGGAGIDQVLASPDMAREAVAAANTPAARLDLENKIRAHLNEKIKNSGVNADRPVGDGPITAEDLNISMAKSVRALLDGKGNRQSIEILTSPEHVRRLDMLANALEAEAKPSKMLRGSTQGSPTQQYTAVDRAAQASSSYYRRITQTALDILNNTNIARQFAADIQLNPELLKQIVLMHRANDPSQITGLIRRWAKNQGKIASTAGELDRGWRKREQAEEEKKAKAAQDEKE